MSFSTEDIQTLADLARVALTADEAEATRAQLSNIFALIEQMQSVDTEGVEPMRHPHALVQRLRDDHVTAQDQRDAFQAIAPQTEAGLYLVPRVVE